MVLRPMLLRCVARLTGSGLVRAGGAFANLGGVLRRAGDDTDSDDETADGGVDQPQVVTFDELLVDLNPQLIGGFHNDLVESSNRRGVHLLDIVLWMRPLWVALEQLRASVLWASRMPGLDEDVVSLLLQAANHMTAGAESVLNNT